MTDMYDSGRHAFTAWSLQTVSPNGKIWWNQWLGEFNPAMTGEEADDLLHGDGNITDHGRTQFVRGWERQREDYQK